MQTAKPTYSRRRALKLLAIGVPSLGVSTTSTGCDGGLIIAIVNIVVFVVTSVIEISQAAQGSSQPSPSSSSGSDIAVNNTMTGEVELENYTKRSRAVEVLVELFSLDGRLQNETVVTVDGELPVVPARDTLLLKLPNLASEVSGEHYLRVTVGGEYEEGETLYLEGV